MVTKYVQKKISDLLDSNTPKFSSNGNWFDYLEQDWNL